MGCAAQPANGTNDVANFASMMNLWEYSYPVPGIVYKRVGKFECTLDIFTPQSMTAPRPVVMYIHGGGWGSPKRWNKMSHVLLPMPYLSLGIIVVHVEYRTSDVVMAPAAVEDCRYALRWIHANAEEYGFDTSKLLVTGDSVGSNLSLLMGFLDARHGFDEDCPEGPEPSVSAVINVFGQTDVADLLVEPNRKGYAVNWIGDQPNGMEVAKRVSPLTYVRPGLPPVLTFHGDKDPVVPVEHAIRLHQALNKAGVSNRLVRFPDWIHNHGALLAKYQQTFAEEVVQFLKQHTIII